MTGDARNRIYDIILSKPEAGYQTYYEALRAIGVSPTPSEQEGNLYAPNPVIVPGEIIEAMMSDLVGFLDARRTALRDEADWLSLLPDEEAEVFGSADVAAQLLEAMSRQYPFAVLDAYLVEGKSGKLDRSYLEWQSFPAYSALGLEITEILFRLHPEVEKAGAKPNPDPMWDLPKLRDNLRTALLGKAIDDARCAVILDIEPEDQATLDEFLACQRLTGGERDGMGIIDPRSISYRDGLPHYPRDGGWVPVKAAMSRLVHDDVAKNLLPRLSAAEKANLLALFSDTSVDWRVHPLHFHLGSKRDFPAFFAAGLSTALAPCHEVDENLISQFREQGSRAQGWVQKPIDGCSGRAVTPNPSVDELTPGCLLQRTIYPAACHRTPWGPREPEVRVMGVPTPDGGLVCTAVYTRVKAPDAFHSNAGRTAAKGSPGSGEGFALIV